MEVGQGLNWGCSAQKKKEVWRPYSDDYRIHECVAAVLRTGRGNPITRENIPQCHPTRAAEVGSLSLWHDRCIKLQSKHDVYKLLYSIFK
jgi:hypothetical protein